MIFRNLVFDRTVPRTSFKTVRTTYRGSPSESIVPEPPEKRLVRTLRQKPVPLDELIPEQPEPDRDPMNIAPAFALLAPALIVSTALDGISGRKLDTISVGDRAEPVRNRFTTVRSGAEETLENSRYRVLLRVTNGIVTAVYADDFYFPGSDYR
jgi:hypothetical protein